MQVSLIFVFTKVRWLALRTYCPYTMFMYFCQRYEISHISLFLFHEQDKTKQIRDLPQL